jgi:hypothetical protein
MADGDIHTVPRAGGWANEREGHGGAISKHPTKQEAWNAGLDLARRDRVDQYVYNEATDVMERRYIRKTTDLGWALFLGAVGAVLVFAGLGVVVLLGAVGPVWRVLIGAAVLGFLVFCRAWLVLSCLVVVGLLALVD